MGRQGLPCNRLLAARCEAKKPPPGRREPEVHYEVVHNSAVPGEEVDMNKTTQNIAGLNAGKAEVSPFTRRRFFSLGAAAAAAIALSPPEPSRAQSPNRRPQGEKSVLMICDYQLGVGDQPYAKPAALRAAAALAAGRKAGMLVVFSKVMFRPGYVDISPRNKYFAKVKATNELPPTESRLIPSLQPLPNEVLIDKDRFNVFTGDDLTVILRSQGVTNLVLAGVATSGVVLSTFCAAADQDYSITMLSDACADPNIGLNNDLMTNLFPLSATVLTVDAWAAGLKA